MIDLKNVQKFCIHSSTRSDRYKTMCSEFELVDLDVTIFDAIYKSPPSLGISESFRSIIRKAIAGGYANVLIFEDDIKFTSLKSIEQMQKCVDTLPDDWGILLGGVYSFCDKKLLKEPSIGGKIKRIGDFAGMHCVLVNERAYEYFLSHDIKVKKNIDRWVGNEAKTGNINAYVCYPMIAVQYDGYSDNVCKETNYSKLLNKFSLFRGK